ncbi:MAG: porin family protein [Flavobacteriales bacterium]
MRNRTIHIVLAIGFASAILPVFAQGPTVGLKAGLNYSTLAVNEADDEKARIGFNGGVFARTSPEDPLGLQVELLYSTKGTHTSYDAFFGLVDQEVDFNLNYLEVPVLLSFRLAEVIDLQVGGYAGYLLNAKVSTSGDLGSGEEELDKDNFTSLDYGVAGGVGLNIGPNAQVGLRYTHGLANVADSDGADLILGDAKNRCAQLYIALGMGGE